MAVFPALLHTSYPLATSDLVPLDSELLKPGLRVSADNRDIFSVLTLWILSQPLQWHKCTSFITKETKPKSVEGSVLNSWHDTVATKSWSPGSQTFCRLPVCDSEQSPLSDLRAGYTMRLMGIYDMKLRYIVRIYRNYFRLGICRQ